MRFKELLKYSDTVYPSLEAESFNIEYQFDEIDKSNYEFDELEKIESFFSDLKTLSRTEGKPSLITINRSEELWSSIINYFGLGFIYPLVSSNIDGDILFSYNTSDKYLGIRICDDTLIELFFKDYVNGEKDFEEYSFVEDAVNSEIIDIFLSPIFNNY
jgi:hypothetical protein